MCGNCGGFFNAADKIYKVISSLFCIKLPHKKDRQFIRCYMGRFFVKIIVGGIWGFFFGICFISGIAFLAGARVYYEKTGSMEPAIEQGSLLFVKKQTKYKQGDIVVFYAEYEGQILCVTHRISQVLPDGRYITKGDANEREDRCIILQQDISGQVLGKIEGYGEVCRWMKEHKSICILMIFVPLYIERKALSGLPEKWRDTR